MAPVRSKAGNVTSVALAQVLVLSSPPAARLATGMALAGVCPVGMKLAAGWAGA